MVDKKNKNIIMIIGIIIFIAFAQNGEIGQKEALKSASTLNECNGDRQGDLIDGDLCVAACVQLSSAQAAEVESCGAAGAGSGLFYYFVRSSQTCADRYADSSTDRCIMDALYGGIPESGSVQVCTPNSFSCITEGQDINERQCNTDGSAWLPSVSCGADSSCNFATGRCEHVANCFDGIKNQDETDVDCGGVCQACTVDDGNGNGDSTTESKCAAFIQKENEQGECEIGIAVWVVVGIIALLFIVKAIGGK